MLSESQFDRIGQALVSIAQRMEHSILTAVVEGLRAISPHASNAAANLRGKGMKSRELRQRASREAAYRRAKSRQRGIYQRTCQQAINTARKEAAEAVPKEVDQIVREAHEGDKAYYRQAGQTPPSDDGLDEIIKDISGQTSEIMDTLLRSAAYRQPGGGYVKARDTFLREVERATNEVLSGNKTFDRAANEAVRGLAREGLKTVDYESGRVMQLDTAVRLNMQTAAAQANGRVGLENVRKTGTNHVEVSRHWGARTDGSGGHADHQAWQGQVYMVDGSDATYRNLTAATGYPGDLLGLFGYNCRHNMFPFWPGISTPNQWPDEPPPREYNGKTYTQTEATDRQRALERQIRALKREALACEAQGDKAAFSKIARRIKEREAEYKRFSEAMDIRAKVERCSVEGYNRSVAGKVRGVDVYEKTFAILRSVGAKAGNYDIIDKKSGLVYHFVEGSKIQNAKTFAGYGGTKPLDDATLDGLCEEFGGSRKKWSHRKGIGYLNKDGEEVKAEIHWFQEEKVGKVKFKVKEYLDED